MKKPAFAFFLLAFMAAAAALDASPRHHEWIAVKSGERSIQTFVAYPEKKEKATVVLVIHENKGLTDWVRGVADQLAEAGYLAVAPDLLSGLGPEGGRTKDFPTVDSATEALYARPAEEVASDLAAVADAALKIPAANGKLTVAGFCWGGGQTLRFATRRADVKGAFVFYGSAPVTDEEIARIPCPVHGFYGGEDARIGATVPKTAEQMKTAGKKFEAITYDGAGHGFMRAGESPDASEANRKARESAWARWKALLEKI